MEVEDYRDEKLCQVVSLIYELLPETNDSRIWCADKEEILCETEQLAESIADLFDTMYGVQTVTTGYYDPEEDANNGEINNRTGYYYVTFC